MEISYFKDYTHLFQVVYVKLWIKITINCSFTSVRITELLLVITSKMCWKTSERCVRGFAVWKKKVWKFRSQSISATHRSLSWIILVLLQPKIFRFMFGGQFQSVIIIRITDELSANLEVSTHAFFSVTFECTPVPSEPIAILQSEQEIGQLTMMTFPPWHPMKTLRIAIRKQKWTWVQKVSHKK